MSEITIEDYLGRHELYRFMSRSMFDTLCAAFVAGRETCKVCDHELHELHRRFTAFRFAKVHNVSQSLAEKILTTL
jgi:hypothetical protein